MPISVWNTCLSTLVACLACAAASCSRPNNPIPVKPPSGKPVLQAVSKKDAEVHAGRPVPMTAQEALQFIQTNCSECHGPGKPLNAAFAIPSEEILLKDTAWLEGSALNQTVYQVLINKLNNASTSPSAMPPEFKSEAEEKKLGNMVSWFQDAFPGAVREAAVRFGDTAPFRSQIAVNLSYKCNQLISGWEFQNRFSLRALGRPADPTRASEGMILTEAEKAAPATAEVRRKVVEALLSTPELKTAFENVALTQLAKKIANAGAIVSKGKTAQPPVAEDVLQDLQSEFSELVKKYYEQKSYPELFLLNKVMVTAKTALLYTSTKAGAIETCAAPTAGVKWAECTLSEQRANFFGTRGFLLSKPTSMLQNNNNYGRGGDTWQVLFGEVLMANTDGVAGDPKPIISCLNATQDRRWKIKDKGDLNSAKAAWGAISVPSYGKVCQGCHLNRHLAAASVIYRPFGFAGEIMVPNDMDGGTNGEPIKTYKDLNLIQLNRPANATGEDDRTHVTLADPASKRYEFISPKFFADLLREMDNKEITCIPDSRSPDDSSKAVKTNSLSKYVETLMYQNDAPNAAVRGSAAVRGLTRFLPSTFANSNQTNLEVISAVSSAFEAEGGKLLPMMKAYFQSETFACSGN